MKCMASGKPGYYHQKPTTESNRDVRLCIVSSTGGRSCASCLPLEAEDRHQQERPDLHRLQVDGHRIAPAAGRAGQGRPLGKDHQSGISVRDGHVLPSLPLEPVYLRSATPAQPQQQHQGSKSQICPRACAKVHRLAAIPLTATCVNLKRFSDLVHQVCRRQAHCRPLAMAGCRPRNCTL